MRKLLQGESLTFLSSFGRRHRRGSVFPATWRFSRVKPPGRDSPWRYVTNCLPNVLPRRSFGFVAEQINSLSPRRAPAVHCLSMTAADSLSWPASFVFPRRSRSWQGWMSQWGAGDKRWQIQNVEYPPICLVFFVFYSPLLYLQLLIKDRERWWNNSQPLLWDQNTNVNVQT